MRILQVGPVPPEFGGRDTGGVETHVRGLAVHLASRGHDVGVLADNRVFDPAAWPVRAEGLDIYGVEDFSGPVRTAALSTPGAWRDIISARRSLGGLGSLRWTAAKIAAYRLVFEDFKPDIIHVHALETRFLFAHVVARGATPIVTTVHSTHYVEFAAPAARAAHERVVVAGLRVVEHPVFVSRYLERRFAELFPELVVGPSARVIPNPIDAGLHVPVPRADARRTLGLPHDAPVLLFVGNLIPRKDPSTLVRAVGRLNRAGVGVRVVIVGSGPDAPALSKLAESEGVSDSVRFEGAKGQAELANYYSAADLFVFPSLMESFGLVAVEAMLHGAPVIGAPEVLEEVVPDRCGIRFPPGDVDALADAITEGLACAWDREGIRRHALRYDWPHKLAEFEELYREVHAGAALPRR